MHPTRASLCSLAIPTQIKETIKQATKEGMYKLLNIDNNIFIVLQICTLYSIAPAISRRQLWWINPGTVTALISSFSMLGIFRDVLCWRFTLSSLACDWTFSMFFLCMNLYRLWGEHLLQDNRKE